MNRRVLGLCLATLVVSGALSVFFLKVSFIVHPASAQAQSIDHLVRVLFSIGGAIFGLVMVVFFYTLLFFRRRAGENDDGAPLTGNAPLELVWTLVPLAIVLVLGVYGAMVLRDVEMPPEDNQQLKVNVVAFQWGWRFEYPEYGIQSSEMGLPTGRSVLLNIRSQDVLHSFWVPEFGPKQDAVPGMTTYLRITPIEIGKYQLQCAELCGTAHSYMTAPVYVTAADDFQTWLNQQQKVTPTATATATPGQATSYGTLSESGKRVFGTSCAVCHGSSGQGGVGPAIIGDKQRLAKYQTAHDLLSFISNSMPQGRPGSLTRQQYVDILAFLLTQNNEIAADAIFEESKLGEVKLK